MAPSSPSERKAVEDAEDRSPDLGPFQPPSQTRANWTRLQWFPEFFREERNNPGRIPAHIQRPNRRSQRQGRSQLRGSGGILPPSRASSRYPWVTSLPSNFSEEP